MTESTRPAPDLPASGDPRGLSDTLGWRVCELLRNATAALAHRPDATPHLEACRLLSEATGWAQTRLLAWPDQCLEPRARAAFVALLTRRLQGEPIAYLLGRQGFWTLELRVTPATLIPRPETEHLVETTLAELPADAPLCVADLGTGSGAVALALASERAHWQLIATDRSSAALAVARSNCQRLGLTQVALVQGDWLRPFANQSLDALVSNPPYIPAQDPHLTQGDLRFEPPLALTPGGDGLDAYRAMLQDAGRCLRPAGLIALEHGADQARPVRQLLAAAGFRAVTTHADLAGHARITCARQPARSREKPS
ncbi:protein-(glutamine-N5) methyltransferase, release factor-specific [Thiocapsa imhoffii]|uniref:Release factor glutamine methyltransferase n=1 Tax=Thiocapsa imhoffii TaxID=382777 RepID=A0A9X0WIJ4_9GAMM|nr:peptide chain release factor N(5)-glutamine methyltransferase [Thiocapsa imhoffii]MBK1645161.1 protein-(glutamine-N5) methyltransferase, release factor-specific [Thiocapsa imhoffii]